MDTTVPQNRTKRELFIGLLVFAEANMCTTVALARHICQGEYVNGMGAATLGKGRVVLFSPAAVQAAVTIAGSNSGRPSWRSQRSVARQSASFCRLQVIT